MSETPTTIPEPTLKKPWLTAELLWLGVMLPAVAAVVDQNLFAWSLRLQNRPDVVAITFAIFVLQVGILSTLVGTRVRAQPFWWGILAWSILLVDLQVFAIAGPHDTWTNPVKAFGHAFGSAQIGLATCWGILGKMKWTTRYPIAVVGFSLSWAFCVALKGRDNWTSVMVIQCLATVVVCLVLRWSRFSIADYDGSPHHETSREKQKLQFSIRHLFYWTTGVAILIGVGRLLGLQGIAEIAGGWSRLTVYAPAFTLITVIAFWAALGSESWFIRFPVLLIALPGVGSLLGLYEDWMERTTSRWNVYGDWRMMPWSTSFEEKMIFWIIWTSLAGMLLAALVLVFRAGRQRLVRRVH